MIRNKTLFLMQKSELNLIKKLVSTILKFESHKDKSQFNNPEIIENLIIEINNIKKERLLILLKRHRLINIFFNSDFLKKYLPNLRNDLKENYILNLQHTLPQISLIKDVQSKFNEHNIKFLIFKGLATSLINYQNLYTRGIGDIDLFIEKDNLNKTIEFLSKLGFRLHENSHYPNKINSIFGRLYLLMRHEVTLIRTLNSNYQEIDLHWRLSPTRKNIPNFNEAWEEKQTIIFNNIEINSLSLKHSFIHSCAHAAKDQWQCLRNLIDIYKFSNKLEDPLLIKLSEIRFIKMSLFASFLISKDKKLLINLKDNNFLKFYVRKISTIKQSLGRKVFGKGKWNLKFRILNTLHRIYFTNSFIDFIYILIMDLINPKFFIDKKTGRGNNLFIIIKLRLLYLIKKLIFS